MRLLNQDDDKPLHRVLVFLTKTEALELRDSIDVLLEDSAGRHEHISSEDYRKEITVCIYDPINLESFDNRSRTLTVNDE